MSYSGSFAEYYDYFYFNKNYENEVEILNKIINNLCKNDKKTLLDVGCGTGNHIKYFKKDYNCSGIDFFEDMILIAKKKNPNCNFYQADMIDFNLNQKFDIITCLFGSIGYTKNVIDLEKTLKNLYDHLNENGIIIIEPWLEPSNYSSGIPFMSTYDSDDLKISRLNISKKENNLSILYFHTTIAEKNSELKYFDSNHQLGLFTKEDYLKIFLNLNINGFYYDNGLISNRGLYIIEKRIIQ